MNDELMRELVEINRRILAAIEGRAGSAVAPATKSAAAPGEIPIAPEDDKYDPKVFRSPKGWQGENYEGCAFSATTPEFLEALATSMWGLAEWQDREGKRDKHGNPSSAWTRKDASRARRWAIRLRATSPAQVPTPPAAEPRQTNFGDYVAEMDDISF